VPGELSNRSIKFKVFDVKFVFNDGNHSKHVSQVGGSKKRL